MERVDSGIGLLLGFASRDNRSLEKEFCGEKRHIYFRKKVGKVFTLLNTVKMTVFLRLTRDERTLAGLSQSLVCLIGVLLEGADWTARSTT